MRTGISRTSSSGGQVLALPARRKKGLGYQVKWFMRRKPLSAISVVVLMLLIIMALVSPWLAPYDPLARKVGPLLGSPGLAHPMGLDHLGRDVLSRVMIGARVSLYVGFAAVFIGSFGGVFVGLLSGYWGGKLDLVVQRIMDGLMSIPGIILALVLVSLLGSSTTNVILAIAFILIPSNSRIVRGATMTTKQNVYVDASRAIGCSNSRIILLHILPNIMAPIIILASIELGAAILVEAALSFLGLGTQPPTPTWGSMLSGPGRTYMERAPWIAIYPGIAISVTVLAFNLLGDGLRDVLDPKQRGVA